ncbi:unnamed protein product [Candidula unifasciata]|uniref:EGF-like domain-containing protein n=1 Tax=Candidula unifasciata TaxID=100452 RepID=A0A8S4A6T8_9EUPU|nr:unnamed protein product [Candidula unifasciata]
MLVNLTCAQPQGTRFKSLIECASGCASDIGCVGVSTQERSCFYHYKCSHNIECGPMDGEFEVYVKNDTVVQTLPQCQNNGTWNLTGSACTCNSGWVGQFCERYGSSCKELAQYGYPQGWPDGLQWATIQLTANAKPVKVLCELREKYFNTYILRNDGWKNLKETQRGAYLNGFYVSNYCFWMGLSNMKAFNDAGYTSLKLDTGFSAPPSNEFHLFQMTYNNFTMQGYDDDFKFTFKDIVRRNDGPHAANYSYGDCLTPLQGAPFIFPNGSDSAEDCVMTAGVGWWYNTACNIACNPLGYKKVQNPDRPQAEYIVMDGMDCENTASCSVAMYFVMY